MAHSKNFEKVKKYYDDGLWTFNRVCNAVGKWITKEELEEITAKEVSINGNNTNHQSGA